MSMAFKTYPQDTILAGIMFFTGYLCNRLVERGLDLALDDELSDLKGLIIGNHDPDDVDFDLILLLDDEVIQVLKHTVEDLADFQHTFKIINALDVDDLLHHQAGVDLSDELSHSFMEVIRDIRSGSEDVDLDTLYLNMIYMVHMLAYLYFHKGIDLGSEQFSGFWHFKLDPMTFSFIDNDEKNLSLLRSMIAKMENSQAEIQKLYEN
jgi:hypothetical protein